MAMHSAKPNASKLAESLEQSAPLNSSRLAQAKAFIERETALCDFRISLAGFVGNEAGNHDRETALHWMNEKRALIQWGISLGVIPDETPTAKQPIPANESRKAEVAELARIHECKLSLALQKRRAIRERNGIASVTESKPAMAALGNRQKITPHENEGITRDKLKDAGSPCLAIVAATVIKTINFPKGYVKQGETPAMRGDFTLPDKPASKAQKQASLAGKGRRKLSPLEECEVFQTAAMVLIANNALHLEIDGSDVWRGKEFGLWSKIYSACRDSLGIDRMGYAEISLPDHDPIFTLRESISTGYDAETVARARITLAAHVANWQRAIDFYALKSTDAKRKANAKNASKTLQAMADGQFTLTGLAMDGDERKKLSLAKTRMDICVKFGLRCITEEQEEQAKRELEKELAMAMHAQFCAACA